MDDDEFRYTASYVFSSALFATSSLIFSLQSIFNLIEDINKDNILSCLANILYVIGYGGYMYECIKEQRRNRYILPLITRNFRS